MPKQPDAAVVLSLLLRTATMSTCSFLARRFPEGVVVVAHGRGHWVRFFLANPLTARAAVFVWKIVQSKSMSVFDFMLSATSNVVVCLEDIKLQMLARSAVVPGLPNFLFFLASTGCFSDEVTPHDVVWQTTKGGGRPMALVLMNLCDSLTMAAQWLRCKVVSGVPCWHRKGNLPRQS